MTRLRHNRTRSQRRPGPHGATSKSAWCSITCKRHLSKPPITCRFDEFKRFHIEALTEYKKNDSKMNLQSKHIFNQCSLVPEASTSQERDDPQRGRANTLGATNELRWPLAPAHIQENHQQVHAACPASRLCCHDQQNLRNQLHPGHSRQLLYARDGRPICCHANTHLGPAEQHILGPLHSRNDSQNTGPRFYF